MGFNAYIKSSVIQLYHHIFKAFTRFPLIIYFTLLNVVYSRDAQAHPRGYSTPFRFQYNFLKIYFLGVKASEGLILYNMSTLGIEPSVLYDIYINFILKGTFCTRGAIVVQESNKIRTLFKNKMPLYVQYINFYFNNRHKYLSCH